MVRDGKKVMGFEVKWKERVKRDFSRFYIGKIKGIICLTKNEISKEENFIPVSIFLSLI